MAKEEGKRSKGKGQGKRREALKTAENRDFYQSFNFGAHTPTLSLI